MCWWLVKRFAVCCFCVFGGLGVLLFVPFCDFGRLFVKNNLQCLAGILNSNYNFMFYRPKRLY